jgi:hypothetical protein
MHSPDQNGGDRVGDLTPATTITHSSSHHHTVNAQMMHAIGHMPIPLAAAALGRIGRAYMVRRQVSKHAGDGVVPWRPRSAAGGASVMARTATAEEPETAQSTSDSDDQNDYDDDDEDEEEIQRRSDAAAAVVQRFARAQLACWRRVRSAAASLRAVFSGYRARRFVLFLMHSKNQNRIRTVASKVVAQESAARDVLLNEERLASKGNFEQLMTIRRVARDERQRRIDRHELVRVLQQKRTNLEDDERGLRHAIVNEATYVAAQLQRSMRERIRAATTKRKSADQTATAGVELPKQLSHARLQAVRGRGASLSAPRTMSDRHNAPPPPPVTLTALDDGNAAPDDESALVPQFHAPGGAIVAVAHRHRPSCPQAPAAPIVVRYEGYVCDSGMIAVLAEYERLVAMRRSLAERRDTLELWVEAVREERDAVQAAIAHDEDASHVPEWREQVGASRRRPSYVVAPPLAPRPSVIRSGRRQTDGGGGVVSPREPAPRDSPRRDPVHALTVAEAPSQAHTARHVNLPRSTPVRSSGAGPATAPTAGGVLVRGRSAVAESLPALTSPAAGRLKQRAAAGALSQMGRSEQRLSPLAVTHEAWSVEARATHSQSMRGYLFPTQRSAATQPQSGATK